MLLGVTLFLLGPASGPTRGDVDLEFCLDLARDALAGRALPRLRPSERLDRALRAFDGTWQGAWDGTPTRHHWRTSAPGLQWVRIEEAGSILRGVDIARGDTLCGIVVESDGRERLHRGWVRRAWPEGPDHLVWRSGARTYLERVRGPQGARRYEIVQLVGGDESLALGVVTTYAELPPHPTPSLSPTPTQGASDTR